MKKILFPIAMMATLLVAGCAKDNLAEQKPLQDGTTVLTAVAAPSVKTVLQDDEKVLWTNGDKINVNGVESAALELEEAAATAKPPQPFFAGSVSAGFSAVVTSSGLSVGVVGTVVVSLTSGTLVVSSSAGAVVVSSVSLL